MLTLRRLMRAPCVLPPIATTTMSNACSDSSLGCTLHNQQYASSCRNASVAASLLTIAQPARRHFHATTVAPHAIAVAATPGKKPTKKSQDSKPTTTGKRKNQLNWNIHQQITIEKTPLPQIFERLCEEITTRGPSIRLRQGIDVFYFNCAQQAASLSPDFIARVVTYFEDELLTPAKTKLQLRKTPLSESLNDGVFTAVVRLLVVQGNVKRAWQLAHELPELGSGKMHFRSVAPILEYECRRGDFETALQQWQQLKTLEMEWTKTMEDVLVQLIIACQRHHQQSRSMENANADAVVNGTYLDHMQELLRDLGLASREITPDNASRLRHAFQLATPGVGVKTLPSNDAVSPACGACHSPLRKDTPSEDERRKLMRAIENGVPLKIKHAAASTKEFLQPFKRWLLAKHARAKRRGKLHYILDGPNIAYLNQNFDNGSFRFDHVDLVARQLQQDGHEVSITIPFSYLEETSKIYIRTRRAKEMRRSGKVTTRHQSPEDKATIKRWQSENLLFSCRTDFLSDDIFWLYASALLGEEAQVVTNDQGRDHVFALLNHRTSGMTTTDLRDANRVSMDLLDRWRESAIVNIEIRHGELSSEQKAAIELDPHGGVIIPVEDVRLIHPAPFSRVPQISQDGTQLHFPIADVANTGHTKWLCIHQQLGVISTSTSTTTTEEES